MKPYYEEKGITIYNGDNLEVMASLSENSIDSVVTDPPYGIRFMGKAWDGADIEKTVQSKMRKNTTRPDGYARHEGKAFASGTYDTTLTGNRAFQAWCRDWAQAVLRIVKPGSMMVSFGSPRVFHRLTAGVEDAGWEIRDCLMWLFGSGFPKSLDISKAIDKAAGYWRGKAGDPLEEDGLRSFGQHYERTPKGDAVTAAAAAWNGWGTALKPAWEPIILAMKPLDGTFAENAERHGVAGLNIDGCRIEGVKGVPSSSRKALNGHTVQMPNDDQSTKGWDENAGRWPANLLLDEEAAEMLDEQSGELLPGGQTLGHNESEGAFGLKGHINCDYHDRGGASRFFYVAKASNDDRGNKPEIDLPLFDSKIEAVKNSHPTVKPLELMEKLIHLLTYLCKLTSPPTGGLILDPFAGSGSTLVAAKRIGRPAIGIDISEEYCEIAAKRLMQEPMFLGKTV